MIDFIATDRQLLRIDQIERLDLQRLAVDGSILIHHRDGSETVTGTRAIEALLILKPSALEGSSVRWIRHAWAVHNLIGHPLMQLLAWLGYAKTGLAVHNYTVPGQKWLKLAR